jgi:uncharacterized protein (TIGR02001 family)
VKHLRTTIIAVAVGTALAPAAQAQLTANIGAVSNYIWRGVSQTDNKAAVQGGVDYGYEGFFVGTWVSNVDFNYDQDNPNAEVDLYGGYGGSVDDFSYKAGLYYYAYPGGKDLNFLEIGVSGAYQATKEVSLSAAVNYTVSGEAPDNAPFNPGDIYGQVGVTVALPQDFSVGLTYGYYHFDDANLDYPWVGASLSKNAGDWGTFGLNISEAWEDANVIAGNNDNSENLKVWVSWVKTF